MSPEQNSSQELLTAQESVGSRPQAERGKTRINGVVLEARKLAARGKKGETFLQDISLYIPSGELVSISGPDQSGKSMLLAVLAGARRPDEGKVQIDAIDLHGQQKSFIGRIGYVSHQNAVHSLLTVNEVLLYAARLRMPRGTKASEWRERVEEVLQLMELRDERTKRVFALSPANCWRLQIAVELVANPVLLFIDEPDELPDPGAELLLMARLRGLARQGLTIVVVTRSPKAIRLCDKLILLTQGGKLAWFGPPEEAIEYFSGSNTAIAIPQNDETESPLAETFGFEDIFAFLENRNGAQQDWAERYKAQPEFEKYVDDPLSGKRPDLLLEDRPLARFRVKDSEAQPPPIIPQVSGARQFFILLGRNFKLILRDRNTLVLAFAVPLVLALGMFLFIPPWMYDPALGDAALVAIVTALLVFITMAVSAFSFSREVVKENAVYRRERQVNLRIAPYVLAKVGAVIPIAIYQALVWTVIYFFATLVTGGLSAAPGFLLTIVLTAFAGGVIGLLASALASSVQASIAWALVLILPQLILSGGPIPLQNISPIGQVIIAGMPSRYAFEALVITSGYATDLANDVCQTFATDNQQAPNDPQAQACPCRGANIFSQCSFPGVRKYATSEVSKAAPPQPTPDSGVNFVPTQPPVRPGETIDQYSKEVNNYTLQLETYHGSIGAYLEALRQYVPVIQTWQQQNSLAIGRAEALLASQVEDYGPVFSADVTSRWLALLGISLVLVVVLAVVQKGKGIG